MQPSMTPHKAYDSSLDQLPDQHRKCAGHRKHEGGVLARLLDILDTRKLLDILHILNIHNILGILGILDVPDIVDILDILDTRLSDRPPRCMRMGPMTPMGKSEARGFGASRPSDRAPKCMDSRP